MKETETSPGTGQHMRFLDAWPSLFLVSDRTQVTMSNKICKNPCQANKIKLPNHHMNWDID